MVRGACRFSRRPRKSEGSEATLCGWGRLRRTPREILSMAHGRMAPWRPGSGRKAPRERTGHLPVGHHADCAKIRRNGALRQHAFRRTPPGPRGFELPALLREGLAAGRRPRGGRGVTVGLKSRKQPREGRRSSSVGTGAGFCALDIAAAAVLEEGRTATPRQQDCSRLGGYRRLVVGA